MRPMPTTRRERFKWYRIRAQIRLGKVHARNRKRKLDADGVDSHLTTRWVDASGWGKQQPKEYPHHYPEMKRTPSWWTGQGWTPPSYKRWGFLGPLDGEYEWGGPGTHQRYAAEPQYHIRRVRSIPPYGSLARQGFRAQKSDLVLGNVYKAEYYPSGGVSFAKGQGWLDS